MAADDSFMLIRSDGKTIVIAGITEPGSYVLQEDLPMAGGARVLKTGTLIMVNETCENDYVIYCPDCYDYIVSELQPWT